MISYKNAIDNKQYQTELGTKGKNLSKSVKESIEALELPGITFTKSVERSYPTGTFASHLIGYANIMNKAVKSKDRWDWKNR